MTVILQKRDEEKRGKRNNATKKKIFVRSDCAKKVDAPGRTVDSKRTKKMSEFSEQKKYQQLNERERERGVLQLFFGLLSDVVTFELEAETKKNRSAKYKWQISIGNDGSDRSYSNN